MGKPNDSAIPVFSAFFCYALALGGLYPRLGDIQLAMGSGEAALGLALIGTGAGTFVSLTFAAHWVEGLGHRGVMLWGNTGIGFLIATAGLVPHPAALFGVLFLVGLLVGAVEIVVNVEADRTEHAVGRRIMSRCHAFWSFGFFGAGMVGAAAKQIDLSPVAHLGLMAPLIGLASWIALRRYEPAAPRSGKEPESSGARFARPSPAVLALVAFTLAAMLLEGAGADWSVIMMRDTFSAAPFVNSLAFAAGALAQALMRFFADGFSDRWGPLVVARTLVSLLGIGTLTVVLAPHPIIAIVGFALIGCGTSAMFPLAMSAAAQRTDRPAAQNVAALAQLSFVAFLVGPPCLGFVAEHVGTRYSFAACLPFVLLSAVFIRALRPRPPAG